MNEIDGVKIWAKHQIKAYKKKLNALNSDKIKETIAMEQEITRIKRAYDELRNGFYKELSVIRNYTGKDPLNKQSIDVKFFDEEDGIDQTIKDILNERIKYLKEVYEERINHHLVFQRDLMIQLARYKALTPDSYGFLNYTLDEVFSNIKIVENDGEVIWKSMKNVFGKTFFFPQIQYEYSQSFSEKDKQILDDEINKIKDEAERNLK